MRGKNLSVERANELVLLAKEAAKKAYCPYSHYRVGAALLCKDGRIFCGHNVENSSYGATICAERVALVPAVAEGYRKGDFTAMAVVGAQSGDEDFKKAAPCGICRQTLSEFVGPDFILIFPDGDGVSQMAFENLFPEPFEL